MATSAIITYLCFLVLLGISLSSSSRVIKPPADRVGAELEHQSLDSGKAEYSSKLGFSGGIGIGIGEGFGSGSGLGIGEGSGSGMGVGFGQGSGFGGSGFGYGLGSGGGSGFGQGSGSGEGSGFGLGGGGGIRVGSGAGECFSCRQSSSGFCCPYEVVVGEVCPSECFECSLSVSGQCCPIEVTRELQRSRVAAVVKRVDDAWAPTTTSN